MQAKLISFASYVLMENSQDEYCECLTLDGVGVCRAAQRPVSQACKLSGVPTTLSVPLSLWPPDEICE